MTTTEILALANKTLQEKAFDAYALSLNNRKFTAMRIIAEICLEKAKDALIENAIREHCDSVVTSNYKLANDLMNETLEFIIVNSEVN
jgi:hypothetical protein